MSTGGQVGQPGGVRYKASLKWAGYADLLKSEAEKLGGVYKPFDQKKLMTAWANLDAMDRVKNGVCRALSASYLCRQYAASIVKDADGIVDEAEMKALAMEDPQLVMSSQGRFFRVFREGRLSDDEHQALREGSKVEREKRPGTESGVVPFGANMRGHLVIKKDGKWLEPRVNGVPARRLEAWRARRVEQVAEAHYEARASRPGSGTLGDFLEVYQGDMDRTMAYFSAQLMGRRNGVIHLPGPYTDWIWGMSNASQGYFMCWVEDHALALAVQQFGWNGYMVKFFDPNFGECKFKKLGDFKKFVGQISQGFCAVYHQTRLDYRMFS